MPTSMLVSLRMSSRMAFNIGAKLLRRWSSSRIMTVNTPVKRLKPGWQTMDLMSWCGLLNPLISILLSIYGATQEEACRVSGATCKHSGVMDQGAEGGDDIGEQECRNLIESMPRRVEAVLKAKGGHTKY